MPALETLARTDLRATPLAALELRCCVLGERDAVVAPQVAAHYARLQPRASVWLVPGAAHAPFLSRPAAVAARVTDFLLTSFAAARRCRAASEDVARSFGRAAAGYERAAALQRTIGEELLALAPPLAPARVLDIGSGTGHFSARLAGGFARRGDRARPRRGHVAPGSRGRAGRRAELAVRRRRAAAAR
ncbi:MAG: hypothetical protein IPM40_19400 [Gammaproteobacteria bacterium]|nr:hypothetical protein [Gammaproteobacteria bacterium]